ncbi:MAG: acyloxyacyl hydrolase [Armatimonadota bacterium]|nr:acyloxyacyl hydrolase [Armatimonadota bacterium]
MLLANFGEAVIQEPMVNSDRLRSRSFEASVAHAYKVLGTSEIRYGLTAAIEWGKPSRALHIKGSRFSAQESAYLRLFRSFKGEDGFNALVVGFGGRWIGADGPFENAYIEAGTGLAISDGVSIDVNSHFNFVSFLGGGFYFTSKPDAPRMGLRWTHISNAATEPPNRGLNQFELVFGFRI